MNCVLVLFDRLPAQRLSCYGNLRAATPAFDRLAATSVVFDQHIADLPPASDRAGGEAPVGTTLTAPLTAHGVRVLDVADAPSQPNSALAIAVTAFDEIRNGDRWVLQVRCAGLPAEATGETGSDTVAAIDAALGALLARIESAEVLLVAGARGSSSPRPPVAEVLQPLLSERIQTPLFARLPQSPWGTRRQSLVALSDLGPTLAEWFGVAPATSQGAVSLLPLLRDEVRTVREQVVIRTPHAGAVRTASWHFLAPLASEGDAPRGVVSDEGLLFRKPEDAWDILNVAPQHTDVVDELSRLIEGPKDF